MNTNAITPIQVRSPCIKVCEMNPEVGLCRGCFRTQDERDWWVAYSNDQRREVLRRCEQRAEAFKNGEKVFAPCMGGVQSVKKSATS